MKIEGMQRISAFNEPRTPVLRFALAALLATFLIGNDPAAACPVCFGDPESDMAQGAMWGILVLGIVVYGVLMGMVGIGVTWFIRARNHVE